MPTLGTDQNGALSYGNLTFRVAKGVVTATYLANVNALLNVPILEVNFLFVSGNSGGPIFDSESSQVVGFVDAFTTIKIRERVEQVTLIQHLPDGMSNSYIENVNALYSLGIKLDRVRGHLTAHGVAL